jgi:crotonobetainyl-CoA:carnitine CoA-transferase CaiB-like acyl-CoA transferase
MRIKVGHPASGEVPLIGSPMKFSRTSVVYDLAPPLLGEHNAEILRNRLGLAESDLRQLQEAGIIGPGSLASRQ